MFGEPSREQRAPIMQRVTATFPIVHDFGKLTLFLELDTSHVLLPHARGAVFGHIIDRPSGERIKAMPSNRDLAVQSTGGRHLLDSCFGAYVALWLSRADQFSILRDPSASLPAYVAASGSLIFAFSDIGCVAKLGLIPIAVDWEMLAHGLLFEQLMTRATAIAGIEEVLPGERLCCGSPSSAELLWKPWTFARKSNVRTGLEDDARVIESTVDFAVGAWARAFAHPHLELSGGLDSSIIAASLARSGASWTCGTLATGIGDADERHYARSVTDHLGVDLLEVDARDHEADPMARLEHITPKPRSMRILAGLADCFQASAQAIEADAVMNGMGGDNVFAYLRSTAPIVDAWRAEGLGLARHIAEDVATATRTPLPAVYAALLRRSFAALTSRRWPADRTYLARSVDVAPRAHPWMRLPAGTAQGLRAHIASIIRIHPFIDCVDRHATSTMVFPLLCQPVMEACLSVPSWRWVEGGHNRALARRAFTRRLPEDVLLRRSKGAADGIVVAGLEKRRPQVKELLLEGHLANAGLLDRRQLEIALAAPFRERASHHTRVLQLIDAELWVRSVRSLGERIALLP